MHPSDALTKVLLRYLLYASSTAKVEQSFSVLRRTFGEQGLHSAEEAESRTAMLVLDRTTAEDEQIVAEAREIYCKYFNASKGSYEQRADKGKETRDTAKTTGGSEAAWLRLRRDRLQQALEGDASNSKASLAARFGAINVDEEFWTDGHDVMVQKQQNKERKRKATAHLDGLLLDAEVTAGVEADAREAVAKRRENEKARAAKARRLEANVAKRDATQPIISKMCCFVEAEARTSLLDEKLRAAECEVTADRAAAQAFILADPMQAGCRVQWCAVLRGGVILTPSAVCDGHGAAIAYEAAIRLRRAVWLTDRFRAEHPTVTRILTALAFTPAASKWQELQTKEEFLAAFARAKRARQPATVCLVKTTEDVLAAAARVYNVTSFFDHLAKLDAKRCWSGACGR
ncbi:MAG: hypothetical protein GY772_13595 [bacterium]|nr:hypothetical protein [bacterium]